MLSNRNHVLQMLAPALAEDTFSKVEGSIHIGSYIDGGGDHVPGRRTPLAGELAAAYRKLDVALGHVSVSPDPPSLKRKFEETTFLSEISFKKSAGVDVRSIDQDSCYLRRGAKRYTSRAPSTRRLFNRVDISVPCTLEFQYSRPHKRRRVEDSNPAIGDAGNGDGDGSTATTATATRPVPLRRSARLSQIPRVDYSQFF